MNSHKFQSLDLADTLQLELFNVSLLLWEVDWINIIVPLMCAHLDLPQENMTTKNILKHLLNKSLHD